MFLSPKNNCLIGEMIERESPIPFPHHGSISWAEGILYYVAHTKTVADNERYIWERVCSTKREYNELGMGCMHISGRGAREVNTWCCNDLADC